MMMPRTVKELVVDLERLRERFEMLEGKCVGEAKEAARREVLERTLETSKSIDSRINIHFRNALLISGATLTFFGAAGYFGIQRFISEAVQQQLSADAVAEIDQIRSRAKSALGEIETARASSKPQPLIVLQTDYGHAGPYMGALKGVIYSINPMARLETITDEVAEFDLTNAAWVLYRASRFYPSGTIFVCITNPGGITTSPVLIVTSNGHMYVGHDNGAFDLVVREYGHERTYTIASPDLSPTQYKELFGGIDVFGPTAARLSLGYELESVGPFEASYVYKLPNVVHRVTERSVTGTIMHVDKYGNASTNISEQDLDMFGLNFDEEAILTIGEIDVMLPLKRTYGMVSAGEPVLIRYEDHLQIAINLGSFATRFSADRGTVFSLRHRGTGR